MSRSSWRVNSSWSGFTIVTALCASMSRAYTGPDFACLMWSTASSTSGATTKVSCFSRWMIWCTSSTTPGMVWCSCTTPSRRNAHTAAPQRREQHPPQRVAEGVAVAPLERLQAELGCVLVVFPLGHLDQMRPDQAGQIEGRHHLE